MTDRQRHRSEWLRQFSTRRDDGNLQVWGISEWHNDPVELDTIDRRLPDQLQAHLKYDVDQVVWDAGRSELAYHSDLPGTTTFGDRDPSTPLHQLFTKYRPFEYYKNWCQAHDKCAIMRLCMNRWYSGEDKFAKAHPDFAERAPNGEVDKSRMCYAIPELRQERRDILLELHRQGADVLILDFCRQPPILKYHPTLVEGWQKESGTDPREIVSYDIRDYLDWFRYRANFLTEFMRELRAGLLEQEAELGRPCCLVPRIPDSSPILTIAAGIDVETWLREDLADATMLSPLVWSEVDMGSHPEYHVEVCHRYGKACIGGIGTLALLGGSSSGSGPTAPPWKQFPFYLRAFRQHQAGVDAMSIYQTDGIYTREELAEFVRPFNDAAACERLAVAGIEQAPEELPRRFGFAPGLDCHSTAWGYPPSGRFHYLGPVGSERL